MTEHANHPQGAGDIPLPGRTGNNATRRPEIRSAALVKRLILELFYPRIMDFARKHPKEFEDLQQPAGPDTKSEFPTETPEGIRQLGWQYPVRDRVERICSSEEGKKLIDYVLQYCPHLFAFLMYTPTICHKQD